MEYAFMLKANGVADVRPRAASLPPLGGSRPAYAAAAAAAA
jgi:hypothetical protein